MPRLKVGLTMKVTNNRIGSATPNRVSEAKSDATDPLGDLGIGHSATASAIPRADTKDSASVNLSDRAQRFAQAKAIAGQPGEVDEAKVARLQKLIDEGKYSVDAQSIADRLVDEHMNLPD